MQTFEEAWAEALTPEEFMAEIEKKESGNGKRAYSFFSPDSDRLNQKLTFAKLSFTS